MLLYQPHGGFFAIPYAVTGLADKVVDIATHLAPGLLTEDANLAIMVVMA